MKQSMNYDVIAFELVRQSEVRNAAGFCIDFLFVADSDRLMSCEIWMIMLMMRTGCFYCSAVYWRLFRSPIGKRFIRYRDTS